MSDRVLHEWTDCGCNWSVREDDPPFSGDPVICRDDKEIESGVLARELARLAARVAELEAENAALRKCLAEARLAMMEPHGEWKDVREAKAICAIREAFLALGVEVDKP